MELIEADDDLVVSLTREELRIIFGSIREAREVLDDWEYPIRMGAEIAEAERLQADLRKILQRTRLPGARP